jgi:transglutaminase-like putative cysteine protease
MKLSEHRWVDVISIGLLIGIHWSFAQRILFTGWDENIFVLGYLISLGTLLGFLLGYSIYNIKTSSLICIAYGVMLIPWQLILLLPEKTEFLDRLIRLFHRLGDSFRLLNQNLPLQDSILFLLMMALITWAISTAAAFRLIRTASPWTALLIEGVIVLLIEYYNYYKISASWFSALFFMFLLLLSGRLYFLKSHKAWQDKGVKTDSEVGFDMGKAATITGLVVILFAWSVPSFVQALAPGTALRDKLGENWQDFSSNFTNLVSPLGSPVRVSSQNFKNTFLLGTGAELGDSLVLESHLTMPRPENMRFYWRSQIFDRFVDNQWNTTLAARKQLNDPQEFIPLPAWHGRQKYEIAVTLHLPVTSVVYAPALPYAVSLPIEVIYWPAEENIWDVAGVNFIEPILAGETYHVASYISAPSKNQLRASPIVYPEWVTDNYLQLPDEFSQKVISLAQEITRGETTNYDRAIAITQYLRDQIEYQELIPPPPDGLDPIEWFLFEHKSGFCNYYATAEILMLRSIGIPARLAVGYAQGEWLPDRNSYLVYQRDGHAWPEVYFPDIGWVEFEPTVSQPNSSFPTDLDHDTEERPLLEDSNSNFINPFLLSEEEPEELIDFDPNTPEGNNFSTSLEKWAWLLVLFVVGAGIATISRVKKVPRLIHMTNRLSEIYVKRGLTPPPTLNRIYNFLSQTAFERTFISVRFALWLHRILPSTPHTSAQLVHLMTQQIPEALESAAILLDEYQRACFSLHPADIQRAKKASARIISISIKSRLTHLKKYILHI